MTKLTPKKIANGAGIAALTCYAVTIASYYLNEKTLLYSFEIVYFIGMCLTLYYLGYWVYAQYKKKAIREHTNLVVSALVFFGILLFVYLIAGKHQKLFDITENKRYSLSQQTQQIVDTVADDIEVLAFFQRGHESYATVERLLNQYVYRNDRISFRMLDPQENPLLTEQYKIDSYGSIVVRSDARQEKTKNPTEEGITNALLRVITDNQKRIAFLTGHGEPSLSDSSKGGLTTLKEYLDLENYAHEELVLMREEAVPEEIDCLVIVSPKTDLFDEELDALRVYYRNGGSVLVLLDPDAVETLEELVIEWGIALSDGLIIDPLASVLNRSPLIPIITQYVPHAITQNFTVAAMLPTARQIDVSGALPEGMAGHALGYTGNGSWVETTPITPETPPEMETGSDIPGPVSIMSVIEQIATGNDETQTLSRLVVVGDSTFVDNSALGLSGNRDLFLNTLAWLARDENKITIRSKQTDSVPMFLNATQQLLFFIMPVVVVPLSIILAGVFVVFRSRRQ